MLNSNQRQRVQIVKTVTDVSRKEAKEALEKNEWDTSMASEWLRAKKDDPSLTLENFQKAYKEDQSKAKVLPTDRYDLESHKSKPNRAQRRQALRDKKKKKK